MSQPGSVAPKTSEHNLFFLAPSVVGYFLLAWYFLKALLYPTENIEFIYSIGIAIFLIEFINIHATSIIFGREKEGFLEGVYTRRLTLKGSMLVFYSVFYGLILAISKNYYLAASGFVSLIAKISSKKALPGGEKKTATLFTALIATTFLVILLSSFLKTAFPFPAFVYESKPPNTSGLFVDMPQTILVWGVLYYSIQGLREIFLFWKNSIKRRK
jgi:hypothetical protein